MSLLTLQLRHASFRGVPFGVSEAEYNAGRRTATHEYPKRDVPYVEDMGRATRVYTMTALIVGLDYIPRAKALMAALEKPGSGRLVHPWLGELNVIATQVGKCKFDTKLGQATISLTFVEAGENVFPAIGGGFLSKLHSQIDKAIEAVEEQFANVIKLAQAADYVVSAGTQLWGACIQLCRTCQSLVVTGYWEALALVDFGLASTNPKKFVSDVADALGFNKLANTKQDWTLHAQALSKLAADETLKPESTEGLVVDSSDEVIVENANAIKEMLRVVLLAQAAGCASFVGSDTDTSDVTGEASTTSYDSMIEVRDTVCEAIDNEILVTESDELAIELEDLRSDVYRSMTEQAEKEARIVTLEFPANMPVVVAAYQMYADADRADEIGRLNSVRNLGFSPDGGLKVLSE